MYCYLLVCYKVIIQIFYYKFFSSHYRLICHYLETSLVKLSPVEDLNDWLPVTEQICIHGRYSDDGSSVKFLQYLDSILTIENNQVFTPFIAYSHCRNYRITWLQ